MIDPKFKDMLTLANMGITPDAITAFQNHRDKLKLNEDAFNMRNSVLFGNTFANPVSKTNATFIPPQEGSMYDPQNQRRQVATKLDMAMTNTPDRFINPLLSPDTFARPSGSTLLNNVNANSAPVIFQNLNKETVLDNLEKTIGDVDKRENKLAKRKERLDAVRRFGLALQGKDPNAMDAKKLMQMLDMQYKTNLMNSQILKTRIELQ